MMEVIGWGKILKSMSIIHQVHLQEKNNLVRQLKMKIMVVELLMLVFVQLKKTFEGRRRGQQLGTSQFDNESLAMSFLSMNMDSEHRSYGDS